MKKPIRQIRIEGNIAYVPLTQGYEAIIDADDVAKVAGCNWYAKVKTRSDGSIFSVYAAKNNPTTGSLTTKTTMHRIIADTPKSMETDHIDGNGLNNRRLNLRSATKAQNQHNQRKAINNKSGVKGVHWNKKEGKWRAQIGIKGKTKSLGLFENISDARAAYAAASIELYGSFGRIE